MNLPDHFRFSQNSLQDYVDCPRRFELKYLLRQEWPAVISEPIMEFELHQQLGRQFHALVQRHLSGISEKYLEPFQSDLLLERWWKNYLTFIKQYEQNKCMAEVITTMPFNQYHLTAKFDCLVLGKNHFARIIDWKTSRHRTSSLVLSHKMQSRIYPYVFYKTHLKDYSPQQIQLIYWFPEYPSEPEFISYLPAKHTEIENYLQETISEIASLKPGMFPLTETESNCQFCVYRSLCKRGIRAGSEPDEDIDLEVISSELEKLDFNTVEEIQF